jgi:hypothetical protein
MEKAESSCLMAVWPPGAEEVRDTTHRLVRNGVQVTSVIYGEVADFPGQSHHHRFEDPLVLREALGCRFYVVVSDMKEALVGIREGERTWGLWSDDLAVVSLTQQFVLQDITIQEMGVALEEAGLSHEVDRILKNHHQRMVQAVRQISPGSAPGSAPSAAPESAQRSPSTEPGHSRRRSV